MNVHASLLPRYRGVAPINWAIVNGETETGVTTMFMARKVDAGEIILTRKTAIGPRETAGELYARLAEVGGDLLVETLDLIEAGTAPRVAQDPALVSYARKLTREDGAIAWDEPARRVFDRIRGVTPWPGAHTRFKGRSLQIVRAEPGDGARTARGAGGDRPAGPGARDRGRDGRGHRVAPLGEARGEEHDGRRVLRAGLQARGRGEAGRPAG